MVNFKNFVAESYKKNNQSRRQITEYLLNTQQFNSIDDFKEVIETMLVLEQFVYHYGDRIISLIADADSSEKYPKQEIKNFSEQLLCDYIGLGQEFSFYWAIYRKFWDEKDFEFPISLQELKDICYNRLVRFVELKEKSMLKCYNLYHACPDEVDQGGTVILQERAHPQKLKFIELYPWEYIKSLIRPYMTPIYKGSRNSFTIDPFAELTFKGWESFWKFLDNFRMHDEYKTHSIKFEKYFRFLEFYRDHGYQPIYLENDKWKEFGLDECGSENNWQMVE